MDFDKLKEKAKNLIGGNEDKVEQGIDKAAELADKVLPESMDDKIENVKDAATDYVEKITDKD